MSAFDDAELVQPASRAELRGWLAANHQTSPGVWLVSFTKSSGLLQLPYEEAVLELLCFGWVDGQTRKIDHQRTAIYVAPRRKGSTWAATNKARVTVLIDQGLMQPAGMAVIERAKSDGSWTILDSVEALEVPDDLAEQFHLHPAAAKRYESMSKTDKKQLLFALVSAKRPQTRRARLERFVDSAR
jgi:uncharacterized protein YdeI (YjbR/CyaY-like superfamily)